jgi:hypothetical protein
MTNPIQWLLHKIFRAVFEKELKAIELKVRIDFYKELKKVGTGFTEVHEKFQSIDTKFRSWELFLIPHYDPKFQLEGNEFGNKIDMG